jgi:parallel beta-helix repeat protein
MNHVKRSVVFSLGLLFSACGGANTNGETVTNAETASSETSSSQFSGNLQANAVSNGLTAEYFNDLNFTGTSLKRIDPNINFAWGDGTPASSIEPDTFSARYSGEIVAPSTGTYTFFTTSDDGVRLNINSKLVINDFNDHAPRTVGGSTVLTAGQRVPFKLEYYEDYGGATLKLEWSGPGVARQVIPTANLFSSAQVTPPTGQTFYVSPTGKDINPGSFALPWATINKAAQTMLPGQSVYVRDGTYTGVYVNRSGTPGKPISFRAYPGAKPKIVITEINSPGFLLQGASYINIDGFDLDYKVPGVENANGKRWEGGITIDVNTSGAKPVRAHHINITNNRVHGFPGGGIGSGLADYIRIEGNTIWETALWSEYDTSGISLYQNVEVDFLPGFHNVIRGNTVFKNENEVPGTGIGSTTITDGNCIIIDDSRLTQKFLDDKTKYPPYKSYTLIENNICAGNGGRGVHVFSSDNVLVRHNTLYKNLQTLDIGDGTRIGGGELTAIAASNVRFINNIVYADTGVKATDTYDGDDPIYKVKNIVFERNLYFGTTNIPNKSSSDLIGDPLFESAGVNFLTANFRLKVGSPAIDKALAGNSPVTDVGGKPRPLGAASDIGAWESR